VPVAPGQLAEQEAFGAFGISAAITSIAEEVIEGASNLLLLRKLTATGMTAWGIRYRPIPRQRRPLSGSAVCRSGARNDISHRRKTACAPAKQ
jgi:hypothetical protein